MKALGSKCWALADGYIPDYSNGKLPEMLSHESISLLNTSDFVAEIELTVFFSNREPAGPYKIRVEPRRTLHQRLNLLSSPEPIPLATDYAMLISSSVEIVVQQTRLDSRQSENALFSTLAFPIREKK